MTSRRYSSTVMGAGLVVLLLLPVAALVLWSFAGLWPVTSAFPTQWSLRAFGESFDRAATNALVSSAVVAAGTAALALCVGVPCGVGLSRLSGRAAAAIRLLVLLPAILPLLAYLLGLQVLLVRLGWVESVPALISVHSLLAIPYVVLVVEGHSRRIDPELELAARTLGASRLQALTWVTLPQLRPSIALGAVLAFLASWSDYLAALTIGTGGSPTLPVTLGALVTADDRAVSGSVALLLLVPVGLAAMVIRRFSRTALQEQR